MALRRIGTAERLAITVSGLLPFAGAAFLGWSIATAIAIALWDALLGTLRIVPASVIEGYEDRYQMRYPRFEMVCTFFGGILSWGLVAMPLVVFAGLELHELVSAFHPGGLVVEIGRLVREEPWWLAFLAVIRIAQCALDILRDKARGAGKVMSVTIEQLVLLLMRGLAILGVAWLAAKFTSLGHGVLVAFLGAACALQVWFELHGQAVMHRPTWREEAGGDGGGR